MKLSDKENELIQKMLSGSRAALAKLITRVENRRENAAAIVSAVSQQTGGAYVLGITGPPGAGKSTFVNCLTALLRAEGKKVGIIAVDPSSPFTGGAVLGDRIRMQDHSSDTDVFIRSIGSRGSHGGLSKSTAQIVKLYDAFGFDVIIIETVGVGQTELDIIRIANTVLVILVPESGDVVQTMKAGLMEIADIFVINKADRGGAEVISREITGIMSLSKREDGWEIPVLLTNANKNSGIKEALQTIRTHMDFQKENNLLQKKLEDNREQELITIITDILNSRLSDRIKQQEFKDIIDGVREGKADPYKSAEEIISKLL